MHLLVFYDISSDRIRGKVACICEDYGLDRIQLSAFYGRLSRNHREELMLRLSTVLGEESGRIQLVPVSTETWAQRLEIAND
ncbi:MAG: CRISPR-associated endonuclease Cas2 [Anaerolineae bacterium]|nr:CRISPR-associated endonuclease Cas2 [Anaerolineae bacterium]NUQ04759.1 CRISPR-associated endonuclease Cas2 [Anaerolineae bacterium]